MNKKILLLFTMVITLIGYGQSHPDNVDLGIFANGSNGSNAGSGADLEFALRIKPTGLSYTAVPAAEDFIMYLRLPKTDFAETDVINIVQTNTALFGATGTMLFQGIFDLGDPLYLYAGLALNAAAGMNLSSLNAGTNAWSFGYTISFTPAKTPTQFNQLRVIDQTNNTFISGIFMEPTYTKLLMSTVNQLTGTTLVVLPVDLLSFSGYKDGNRNQLRWSTASELNNRGFEVQRSLDGVNYTTLTFVNSLAPGGYSSVKLDYAYTDNNVTGARQFYRLRQVDFDGRSKLSNIVLLKSDKPNVITLDGMFPNPASTVVNLMLSSPVKDKVQLVVTDMSGRITMLRQLNVEMGSNTLPVNVAALAGGTYLLKMISSNGEVSTGKLVKQ